MLRTTIVMDYQNVHLTGHGTFLATRNLPRHQTLVDPLMFAGTLLRVRNRLQRPGMDHAELHRVLAYRGQPSADHDPGPYGRNQAQKAHWERDPRVSVTLRPLRYEYQRDATGRFATDINGKKIPTGYKQEKGIDVLCALALVREARDPNIDLVILASADSDLAPALDEVLLQAHAKVETFCWYDTTARYGQQLRPSDRTRRIWNTRLSEADFRACWDPTDYK